MPHLRGLVFGLISHFSLNSSFLFCSFQNISKKFLFTFVCTVLDMVSWHSLEGGLGDGDGVLQQKLDLHHQGITALAMCCLCHFKLENL